jgi:hypothetical protein
MTPGRGGTLSVRFSDMRRNSLSLSEDNFGATLPPPMFTGEERRRGDEA